MISHATQSDEGRFLAMHTCKSGLYIRYEEGLAFGLDQKCLDGAS